MRTRILLGMVVLVCLCAWCVSYLAAGEVDVGQPTGSLQGPRATGVPGRMASEATTAPGEQDRESLTTVFFQDGFRRQGLADLLVGYARVGSQGSGSGTTDSNGGLVIPEAGRYRLFSPEKPRSFLPTEIDVRHGTVVVLDCVHRVRLSVDPASELPGTAFLISDAESVKAVQAIRRGDKSVSEWVGRLSEASQRSLPAGKTSVEWEDVPAFTKHRVFASHPQLHRLQPAHESWAGEKHGNVFRGPSLSSPCPLSAAFVGIPGSTIDVTLVCQAGVEVTLLIGDWVGFDSVKLVLSRASEHVAGPDVTMWKPRWTWKGTPTDGEKRVPNVVPGRYKLLAHARKERTIVLSHQEFEIVSLPRSVSVRDGIGPYTMSLTLPATIRGQVQWLASFRLGSGTASAVFGEIDEMSGSLEIRGAPAPRGELHFRCNTGSGGASVDLERATVYEVK